MSNHKCHVKQFRSSRELGRRDGAVETVRSKFKDLNGSQATHRLSNKSSLDISSDPYHPLHSTNPTQAPFHIPNSSLTKPSQMKSTLTPFSNVYNLLRKSQWHLISIKCWFVMKWSILKLNVKCDENGWLQWKMARSQKFKKETCLNPLKKTFICCVSLPYLNVFFFSATYTKGTKKEDKRKCELKMKKLYFVYWKCTQQTSVWGENSFFFRWNMIVSSSFFAIHTWNETRRGKKNVIRDNYGH